MFPNLLEATNEYWRKLDEVEAAYNRGELSDEEVSNSVKELMAELGQERRLAFSFVWQTLQRWLTTQRETVVGLAVISIIVYVWALNGFAS